MHRLAFAALFSTCIATACADQEAPGRDWRAIVAPHPAFVAAVAVEGIVVMEERTLRRPEQTPPTQARHLGARVGVRFGDGVVVDHVDDLELDLRVTPLAVVGDVEAEVDGAVMTWRDVAQDSDVVQALSVSHLKELVVLRTAQAPRQWAWRVTTRCTPAGNLSAILTGGLIPHMSFRAGDAQDAALQG